MKTKKLYVGLLLVAMLVPCIGISGTERKKRNRRVERLPDDALEDFAEFRGAENRGTYAQGHAFCHGIQGAQKGFRLSPKSEKRLAFSDEPPD